MSQPPQKLSISLADTILTQTRTYNGYGELTTLSDNTFGYELKIWKICVR